MCPRHHASPLGLCIIQGLTCTAGLSCMHVIHANALAGSAQSCLALMGFVPGIRATLLYQRPCANLLGLNQEVCANGRNARGCQSADVAEVVWVEHRWFVLDASVIAKVLLV